ncbi:MAG: hypothetical protein KJN76_12590 [Eudoraea sp.]|nr:hypothetical protein [Eudoraea sp.]
MGTHRLILLILLLTLGPIAFSQSQDKKKEENDAAKKAQRMRDSMMNTPEMKKALEMQEQMMNSPQMKAMMDQISQMEEQQKAEEKMREATRENANAKKAEKNNEDFYWRNTVASNTKGKFPNWSWGAVDIAIYDGDGKMDSYGEYIDKKYVIIGNISSDGQVTFNFPENITTPNPINKSLIPQMHSVTNNEVVFSNPDTPFRQPGFILSIIKNNDSLGSLFIGNSEKTTYNLAAPCCLSYGDEGYRLYWVYVKEACSANLKKEFKQNKVLYGESERIVDQSIIYDMNFKPGWNLIKTEVRGNYMVGNRTFFKDKIHTVVPGLPEDARYYFKYDD